MEKRWISLYVENEIGVLAKISGLFSAKSYNLLSLTVGETEDETVSRMTIGLLSDAITFEQIKKQLIRSVSVIKVIDLTDVPVHRKELLFIRISKCQGGEIEEIFRIAKVFGVTVCDYGKGSVILECLQTEGKNHEITRLLREIFGSRIQLVRGGSVAIEAIFREEE